MSLTITARKAVKVLTKKEQTTIKGGESEVIIVSDLTIM